MSEPTSTASRRRSVDSDERLRILEHIGLRVLDQEDPDDPTAVCEVDVRDDLRNLAEMLQGGVLATLLDVAAGVVASRAARTRHVLTQDLHITYLRPVRVGPARAVGRVVRQGKRSVAVTVELYDVGVEEPELATFATSTLAVVGDPEPDYPPAPGGDA